jgi:sulfite reductase alpha subunit-like flavoprotein
MSFTDAVGRVSQIQAQISSLQTAFDPSVAGTSATQSTTGTAAAGSAGTSSFAAALAQAQQTGAASDVSSTGGAALPAGAQSQLTSDQQQFASSLAAQTGLDPSVISAWLLAEESGGAAQSRQAQNNNDWLNIGYTDSGTYGSADSIWSNPTTAATATAGWLKGQNTIPGYGTASSGIQGVLSTAGQPASVQIAALQNSGWASSGYPSLPSLYQQVAG